MQLRSLFYILIAICGYAAAENKVPDSMQSQSEQAPLFYDGKGFYTYKKPVDETPSLDKKLMLVSFFDYDCAVCVVADDYLRLYAERNPDKVELQRIPYFNSGKTFVARMHATFVELGRPELSDLYLFESDGRKGERSLVGNEEAIERWLENHNVDIAHFKALFASDVVKNKATEYAEMYRKYRPIAVPFVSVNGKFVLVRNTLYNDDYTYAVLDHLYENQDNPEILSYSPKNKESKAESKEK